MIAKTILVGYDRSAGAAGAARWALDEAARTGARVEFLYAWEWPAWTPAASLVPGTAVWPDGEADQAIHEMLDAAVADARESHPDVPVVTRIVHAPAALTLIELSAQAMRLDERLAVFQARYPQVKVTADVIPEHPAAALDRAAAGAGLVVVGSRGRGPVRGVLLGSVSRHLLHRCSASIAIVRAPTGT